MQDSGCGSLLLVLMAQRIERGGKRMKQYTLVPYSNELGEKKAIPPKEVKLFPLGLVKSQKGDFLVDLQAYHSILEHFQSHNVDIPIDYEHQTLEGVQAPAAGWVKSLNLKEDGVYAAVEWTEKATEYLKNREYRYLSPVVGINLSDRRARLLHSIALTNTPAIDGMAAVVNSARFEPFSVKASYTGVELSHFKQGEYFDGNKQEETNGQAGKEGSENQEPVKGNENMPDSLFPWLLEILGLPDDSDIDSIKERIQALLSEHSKMGLEINSLRFESLKQQADQQVNLALKEGKLLPYQKDWAFETAIQQPDFFKKWVENTPQVIPLYEINFGTEQEAIAALKAEPPRSRTQELMGVTNEELEKYGSRNTMRKR